MFNAEFFPPTNEIKYDDVSVMSVRGLSLVDVSYLVSRHRADLEKLFELYQSFAKDTGASPLGDAVLIGYGYELLGQAPAILANVIAVAADARDQVEAISRLPSSLQIDALRAICSLTIEDFGGLKPLLAKLMQFVAEVAPASRPE